MIEFLRREKIDKRGWYIYLCDCGKEFKSSCGPNTIQQSSCGCSFHNHTGKRIHNIWLNMRERCSNKNHPSYKYYGGRGITVCDRWATTRTGFINFLSDMGYPKSHESIDRIDNDGNYEPINCRWANKNIQSRNKSSSVYITYSGKTKNLSDWAIEIGISRQKLTYRLKHWNIEDAMKK